MLNIFFLEDPYTFWSGRYSRLRGLEIWRRMFKWIYVGRIVYWVLIRRFFKLKICLWRDLLSEFDVRVVKRNQNGFCLLWLLRINWFVAFALGTFHGDWSFDTSHRQGVDLYPWPLTFNYKIAHIHLRNLYFRRLTSDPWIIHGCFIIQSLYIELYTFIHLDQHIIFNQAIRRSLTSLSLSLLPYRTEL